MTAIPAHDALVNAQEADARALELIRTRLEALLGESGPVLQSALAAPMADELVVCGIVGGKDVGKTTLLRSLIGIDAGQTAESVEGTCRPRFYVHLRQRETLLRRFPPTVGDDQGRPPFDLLTHQHDPLERLVLVDLPDFDSEYIGHVRVVNEVLGLLDRVIWVMSPRKAADRTWLQLFQRFAKDGSNVCYVLSKGDELLADAMPHGNGRQCSAEDQAREMLARQRAWFGEQLYPAVGASGDSRLFVVAAAHGTSAALTSSIASCWDDVARQKYAADYPGVDCCAGLLVGEMDRLREILLSPITEDDAHRVKQANRKTAVHQDIGALRRWARLGHWISRFDSVIDADNRRHRRTDHFPVAMRQQLGATLSAQIPQEGEAVAELFAWRVERYPLLRWLGYPMTALFRLAVYLGRSAGRPSTSSNGSREDSSDHEVRRCCEELRTQFLEAHQPLLARFRLVDSLPDALTLATRLTTAVSQAARSTADEFWSRLRARTGRRSWLLMAGLIAVSLWFPLIQPVSEAGLSLLAVDGFSLTMQAGAKLVAALGPTKMLEGLLVVLLLYCACLGIIYGWAVRDVRRLRAQWTVDTWQESSGLPSSQPEALIDAAAIEPLVEPLARVQMELVQLDRQLRELERRYE